MCRAPSFSRSHAATLETCSVQVSLQSTVTPKISNSLFSASLVLPKNRSRFVLVTSTGLGRLRGRSITLRGPPNSVLHSFRTSKPCLDLIFLKAVRYPWLLRLQYPVFLTGLLPLQEQDPLHAAVDFWMQRSGQVFQPLP